MNFAAKMSLEFKFLASMLQNREIDLLDALNEIDTLKRCLESKLENHDNFDELISETLGNFNTFYCIFEFV